MFFIGELSALGAAFLWSFSSFLFTTVTIRIGTILLNITRMLVASILLLATIYLFNIDFAITDNQLLYLTISGFIGLVIGDSFLFKSFGTIGPRLSMLIMSFNPAIAAITAFFVLGEVLSLFGIIGMAVTLAGISIVVLEKPLKNNSKFKITRKGIFYGFMGAAGQGVGLVFAKMAYTDGDVNTIVATFIRIASAVILMFPLTAVMGMLKNPIKILNKDKGTLGLIFFASIIGPYLGIALSFLAVVNTKVGIASTLMSTAPILMLPLSKIFYKEHISWKSIIGALVAVFGVAILFLMDLIIWAIFS